MRRLSLLDAYSLAVVDFAGISAITVAPAKAAACLKGIRGVSLLCRVNAIFINLCST